MGTRLARGNGKETRAPFVNVLLSNATEHVVQTTSVYKPKVKWTLVSYFEDDTGATLL